MPRIRALSDRGKKDQGKVREANMGNRGAATEAAILEAGKQEFLTYGYEKASLRRIASMASVTTGAIYGYFSGKEALFQALTGDAAQKLAEMYEEVHRDFAGLPPEMQPNQLSEITEQYVPLMIGYIYDHYDAFKLMLCCNAPGASEQFFDRLVKVEEQSCRDFTAAMKKLGCETPELDDTLIHILCRSFFQQIEEFVFHDVPRERAVSCAVTLSRFQHAGWMRIMNL